MPFPQLRIMSDLHIGQHFDKWDIPLLTGESDQILVLAGDISAKQHIAPQLLDWCVRFRHVVYVFGNHEYWGQHISTAIKKLTDKLPTVPDNLHILDGEHVVLDGICFVGATLWTNYNNSNPIDMIQVSNMSDFKKIRLGPNILSNTSWGKKITPSILVSIHNKHMDYICSTIRNSECAHNVVVTHMAPSHLSVSPQFVGDPMTSHYVSDLWNKIQDLNISIWCHGHLHNSSDYLMGDIRVICNPRGYLVTGGTVVYDDRNKKFNCELLIDLE